MVNYQKGKIYTIRSRNSDNVYVGSTCNVLRKRIYEHKTDYKNWINGNPKYISSYEVLKDGACYIELFEKYPCNSKDELKRREGEVMRSMECVNKKKWIGMTREEMKEHWKEYYKEYHKNRYKKKDKKTPSTYNPNNPNFIRIKCECGHVVRTCMMSRHKRSGTHIYFMNERENNQEVS